MWRIVALGAIPAALLGAGSGLFFSRDFVDYRPMGEIYMAQDSIGYVGGPPAYMPPVLGGSGPFYVAPADEQIDPAPFETGQVEKPMEGAIALSGPSALSAGDKVSDTAAIEPVQAPENPISPRHSDAVTSSAVDQRTQAIQPDVKRSEVLGPANPDAVQ